MVLRRCRNNPVLALLKASGRPTTQAMAVFEGGIAW
jgi:hypothetical protein